MCVVASSEVHDKESVLSVSAYAYAYAYAKPSPTDVRRGSTAAAYRAEEHG
jgi:hypothetical protein